MQSAKTRPGADCGSDRELLIAKFRLKLKKVGKNHWICIQFRRPGFDSWVRKIPWRGEWQPTAVFLPGEYHGPSLADYHPWGRKELETIQVWLKSNPLWLYSGSDNQIQGSRSDRQSARRTMDGGLWLYTGGDEQNHLPKKKCKKVKWLSEEALQIAEKRREVKGKGEKEWYTHMNTASQRTVRR